MKTLFALLFLVLISSAADASILDVFKDEAGKTKWQHVANFSGSVLIILLSILMISLLASRFKLRETNKELTEIKKNLESTVRKRTENLNKANRLLEGEVAERQAAQNYLRSILASMPSMLIGLNEQHEVTHWNHTAESITGFKESQMLGQNLWEAYPAITVAPEQVDAVLKGGKPEIIKHRQRGQYYFDITIYPLEASQLGVVLVIENVTQRSLAENMLIQRDKMASMGELAATMAHDINIPLQGIQHDVSKVLAELEWKQLKLDTYELLSDAIEQGKQASAVVQNLLAFSGSHGTEKQTADMSVILGHCIELAGTVLADTGGLKFRDVTVEKDFRQPISRVNCYVAELQQVFLSVFRHACHALGKSRAENLRFVPKIRISVVEELGILWVRVTHNGECLSSEEQQEIFEPIVQHTTPVNPKPLEVTNRLSFSYFIVTEHHDGEMAVTSDHENGTTFHIQFHLPD